MDIFCTNKLNFVFTYLTQSFSNEFLEAESVRTHKIGHSIEHWSGYLNNKTRFKQDQEKFKFGKMSFGFLKDNSFLLDLQLPHWQRRKFSRRNSKTGNYLHCPNHYQTHSWMETKTGNSSGIGISQRIEIKRSVTKTIVYRKSLTDVYVYLNWSTKFLNLPLETKMWKVGHLFHSIGKMVDEKYTKIVYWTKIW